VAHFAELDENNIVIRVVVVSNEVITDNDGNEQEQLGVDFLNNLYGTRDVWKQTSYNQSFRKNFAGKGYSYDQERDAFIPPQPYESWTLDEETCLWTPPTPYPTITDENKDDIYIWNETTKTWEVK